MLSDEQIVHKQTQERFRELSITKREIEESLSRERQARAQIQTQLEDEREHHERLLALAKAGA